MSKVSLAALTITAGTVLSASGALADHKGSASTYDWSGFYLGAQAGGVFGEADVSIPLYPSNFSMSTDGFSGGLYTGFNFQQQNWIFGVEGDANLLNVSGDNLIPGSPVPGERYRIDQDWDASVRARLGFAADEVLFYATGGVAFSELETRYIPLAGGVDSHGLTGWTAGAGVEVALLGNLTGRAQYRYTGYGSEDFFHNGPSKVDYDTHSVTVGLGWFF
jgi:outer membrane immunogenic protein